MKTQYDYTIPEIEACLIVMRELFTYLKPYRNQIALIGGWVPYFLLEKYSGEEAVRHVGSLIVFKSSEVIHLSGSISNRAHVECDIKIANIAACFIMKGIALGERTSEKDAYDLYMLTRYYKEGPKSVLEELSLLKHKGSMREAMRNIEESFKQIDSIGPVSVAEFIGETDNEGRIMLQRDVYEVMQFIIEGMKAMQ